MLGQACGIQVHSIMSNIINRLSILIALSSWEALSVQADQTLRAGAYVQDVTGSFDSYLVSGGFLFQQLLRLSGEGPLKVYVC